MTAVDIHVGRQVYRRRRLLGLTQTQLAQFVGIRFQQIQRYECGANRVTAGRLYELAVALDVSTAYFFNGLDSPQRIVAISAQRWPEPSEQIENARTSDASRALKES